MGEVNIYRPLSRPDEKPLDIDKQLLSYAPKLLELSQDGFIGIKLDEKSVAQRISNEIYSNPMSAVREYLNNEARACRVAAKQYGANPRIEITLWPNEKMLVIHGVDSLGISQERFTNIYVYLGRSDNFDGREAGQFGFGKASYTCIADVVKVETYSREDGTKYAFLGKGGLGYNLLPEPDIDSYGTRVTFYLKEGIDIVKLVEYIADALRFLGVETYLTLEDDIDTHGHTLSIKATPTTKGRHRLGPMTYEEYIRELMPWINDWTMFRIEDEDFTFVGAFPVVNERVVNGSNQQVRLIGVPIKYGLNIPIPMYILDIKNERKYQPTADRERLKNEAEVEIKKKILERLPEALSFLHVHSLKELVSSKYRAVLLDYASDLREFLPSETVEIATLASSPVLVGRYNSYTKKFEMREYKLYEIIGENVYCMDTFNWKKAEKLRIIDPTARVFRFRYSSYHVEYLRSQGISIASDELSKVRIKLNDHSEFSYVSVHSSDIGTYDFGASNKYVRRTERVLPADVGDDVIRIPQGELKQYLELFNLLKTDHKIVADSKKLSKGIALSGFLKRVEGKTVITNKGEMTFSEIAKYNPYLIDYDRVDVAELLASDKRLFVFGDGNTLFELALYLRSKNVEFKVDVYGRLFKFEEFFGNEINVDIAYFVRDPRYCRVEDSRIFWYVLHVLKVSENRRDFAELFVKAVENSRAEEIKRLRDKALRILSQLPSGYKNRKEVVERSQE